MALVFPSLLSADFLHLGRDVEMVNASDADALHLDIMDGLFVPNISFGFPVVRQVAAISTRPLDVHLMIIDPDRYLGQFREAGASMISVHYEACPHLHRTIHAIRSLGAEAGVVLNPHTPVSVLSEIITDVDFVLLMSVNPGFGGQHFIENTYRKIIRLKMLISQTGSSAKIQVDGGVTTGNAGKLVAAGVDILVAGNSVFASPDPASVIRQMKHAG